MCVVGALRINHTTKSVSRRLGCKRALGTYMLPMYPWIHTCNQGVASARENNKQSVAWWDSEIHPMAMYRNVRGNYSLFMHTWMTASVPLHRLQTFPFHSKK